jgi:predicted P-loop ATPase
VASDLTIQSFLPEGWHGQHGNTRRDLKSGDLSLLLRQNLGTRLRWNLLQKRIELDGEPLPAAQVDLFHVGLSESGYTIGKESAIDAIRRVSFANEYNPVEEYLNRVAADPDIEPIDLKCVATEYLGTQDPLYNTMLAATLIGAVARTFQPGCKHDSCLVLKGGQGIGKSSLVKALASPSWLNDTTQPKEKETLQAIHSCWVMELAELDSLTSRKEAGTVKALLSSSIDKYQPPYGRTIEECPRRSIMIGTCNRDDFLRDDTGSRRFWVIDLHHDFATGNVIDVNRITTDRDRILKAAVLAYRDGQPHWLSNEDQNESNRRNLNFEQEHPWESIIARWLSLETPQGFTTEECLLKSDIFISQALIQTKDMKVASTMLQRLGYKKTPHQQRRYSNKRVWFPASDASGTTGEPEASDNPAGGGDPADSPHASFTFSKKNDEGIDGQAQPPRWEAAKKSEAPEAGELTRWHTGVVTTQVNEISPRLSDAELKQKMETASRRWD